MFSSVVGSVVSAKKVPYVYIRVCLIKSERGLAQFIPITRFCAEEHRAHVDGRATARHLHGKKERAARCLTVKVSAESAGAVASTMFFQSLTNRQSRRLAQPDGGAGTPAGRGCHLQGRSAPHHCGPLHEGRGLTHALTHIAPTDLTVAAALVRKACSKEAAALAPVVETGESEDVWTRATDFIAIVQAFEELRYGVVVHTRENSVKYGHNLGQTL